MFGFKIISESEYEYLRKCAIKQQKFWQLTDWFSGWSDIKIIRDYVNKDVNFGGIERARKDYAEARGTDEYGVRK